MSCTIQLPWLVEMRCQELQGFITRAQAGLAGLARGIAAWDPSRGTRLGSCCYYYIMDEVGLPNGHHPAAVTGTGSVGLRHTPNLHIRSLAILRPCTSNNVY